MGKRLGVKSINENYLEGKTEEEKGILEELNTYPKQQLISEKDWESIQHYYKTLAPNEPLPQTQKSKADKSILFQVSTMSIAGDPIPKTSMLYGNEFTKELFIGEARNILYVMDSIQTLFTLPEVNSPPVFMTKRYKSVFDIVTVGSIDPSDLSLGRIYEINFNIADWKILADSLSRPVHATWADLMKDGKKDLIISEYGNNIGGLLLLKDGKEKQVIFEKPGTRLSQVYDFNADGFPDIMLMHCQGDEGITILYNNQDGTYREDRVLSFHPLTGLSYFQLADFNNDSFPDILLSNGDNWDYSSVRKNYHGIRIFLNDGKNQFSEEWFYPQYGTAKALAYDFDLDGDLDIASIAFYDELDKNEERFLYFENDGNLQFKPQFVPEAAFGKWLCMEIADLDNDGDKDIYLGSYFHSISEISQFMLGSSTYPQILILKNTIKKGG